MYKYLRQAEYQIHSLLKATQTISEITRLLGRHRRAISRELKRGRGQRGYRTEQASRKTSEREQRNRNARRVHARAWANAAFYLGRQWSPKQIADEVDISHESVYLHVYADKAVGSDLYQGLRGQKPQCKRSSLHGRDSGEESPADVLSTSGRPHWRAQAGRPLGGGYCHWRSTQTGHHDTGGAQD